QAIAGERFVVVVADPAGGDLVGGDVGDERLGRGWLAQIVAAELALQERRIFGEIEDAPLDLDALSARDGHGASDAAPLASPGRRRAGVAPREGRAERWAG